MSRHEAIKKMRGKDVQDELAARGILVKAKGRETLSEEASYAYKDVADVVETCHGAGISRMIAKMRPLGVVKGSLMSRNICIWNKGAFIIMCPRFLCEWQCLGASTDEWVGTFLLCADN